MKIRSFGCSLIFGTDLIDDGRNSEYATASNLTWPALLASRSKIEFKCHAQGGTGNLCIFDRICRTSTIFPDSFFIIGWTWIDRFDYSDPNGHHFQLGKSDYKTITPTTDSDIAKVYYRNLHSEYKDKLLSLTYINAAIDLLNSRNQKFLMTCVDDLIFCKKYHTSPYMNFLQTRIKPYIFDFEGRNFIDWSKSKNFSISDSLHPLEDAHAAAADLFFDKFQTLVNSKNNLS
jgi:hypothetical protein